MTQRGADWISFPAPAFCQFNDEELTLALGAVMSPGVLERPDGTNGLRIWVEGDPKSAEAKQEAVDAFQVVLGAARALHPEVGELKVEMLGGLGEGSVQDGTGAQFVILGSALYTPKPFDEVVSFGTAAATGVSSSQPLRNALWLNGRANRTSADYFMILEYAHREFGGEDGVRAALGVSRKEQGRLGQSANNLAPLHGGRHAVNKGEAPWSLGSQRSFAGRLLRQWVEHYV